MRAYSMSFGMNDPLVDFHMKSDEEAKAHAVDRRAEYCVRTKGLGGWSLYTILEFKDRN